MTRYLFSLMLMVSVALIGVLPHATMAIGPQEKAAICHGQHDVSSGSALAFEDCGTPKHSMSGGCAIACLGSIAIGLNASEPKVSMTYRPVLLQPAAPPVFEGFTGETADRPPKSV